MGDGKGWTLTLLAAWFSREYRKVGLEMLLVFH
jgi:hypothetical protein